MAMRPTIGSADFRRAASSNRSNRNDRRADHTFTNAKSPRLCRSLIGSMRVISVIDDNTMILIQRLLLCIALALTASPTRATDVVYPPGSRIGLVPPSGVVTSKNFFGYEDAARNVGIILAALPADAYRDLEKSITPDALKKQGVTQETREALSLATGKAFLVIGRQEVEKVRLRKWFLIAGTPTLTALITVQVPDAAKAAYPDAAIRAALQSLAVRATIPVEEQLSLLPFKLGDLAGFGSEGSSRGAVMLGDGLGDAPAHRPRRPASTRTSSWRSRRAARRRPASAIISHAMCSRPFPTSRKPASPPRVVADGRPKARSSPAPRTRRPARRSWWCNGCASAAAAICRWSGWRAEDWKDAYPRFRVVRDGIEPR